MNYDIKRISYRLRDSSRKLAITIRHSTYTTARRNRKKHGYTNKYSNKKRNKNLNPSRHLRHKVQEVGQLGFHIYKN